jgi:hypothetical protein
MAAGLAPARCGRGDPGHRFQHRGHLGPRELVIAVPALRAHRVYWGWLGVGMLQRDVRRLVP